MQKVETISKNLASKRPQEIWSRPSVKPRQYNLCDYDGLNSLNSLGSLLEVLHQGNERIAILLVASIHYGGISSGGLGNDGILSYSRVNISFAITPFKLISEFSTAFVNAFTFPVEI